MSPTLLGHLALRDGVLEWADPESASPEAFAEFTQYADQITAPVDYRDAVRGLLAAVKKRRQSQPSVATYTADPVATPQPNQLPYDEVFSASDVRTIYDPLDAARVLRQRASLPTPDLDAVGTPANRSTVVRHVSPNSWTTPGYLKSLNAITQPS